MNDAYCNYAKLINKGILYKPHKWTRRSSREGLTKTASGG